MADSSNGKTPSASAQNGTAQGPSQAPAQAPTQVRVIAQFVKDLSFENPSIERLMQGPGEDPNLQVEVNVGANRAGPADVYESGIEFKATATNKAGVIYDMEVSYGGLFEIKGVPPEMLEPFLLINCPALLFPFVRRLVADVTREGGFPPLYLDPIDFAGLYMQRKADEAKAAAGAGATTAKG